MAKALTAKEIDAYLRRRPTEKREIADGGQPGLYLVAGPRSLKWIVRYRSPGSGQNIKLALGEVGTEKPALGLHDARKAAKSALDVVRDGRDPRDEDVLQRRHIETVEQAFADFLERHTKIKNKATTASDSEGFIRREILPKWRTRRIRSITRREIVSLIDAVAEGKRGANGQYLVEPRPQSAVRLRALLSKAFSFFAAKGVIAENPFRDVEVPAKAVARDRVLSDDEIRLLWTSAGKVGWPFGDLAKLLLLTGQRRDEVAAAPWAEFALEGDQPTWSIDPKRTKNGREQNLPLPSQVLTILKGLPRIVGPDGKESSFILSTTGSTPVSGYSRGKAQLDAAMLRAASEEAADPEDVKIDRWTLHDLRRTAASGMAALGTPVHVVEAILNHKSGQISGVAAIYNRHKYLPEKRAALAAWAARVAAIVEGQPPANVIPFARS